MLEKLHDEAEKGKTTAVELQKRNLEQAASAANISGLENQIHALEKHNRDLVSQNYSLHFQVTPFRGENSNLRVQFDALKNRVHTLEEENGRLVVDPVEHQLLKDQISIFTVKFNSIESVFAEEKAKLVNAMIALEAQLANATLERDSVQADSETLLKEIEKLKASSQFFCTKNCGVRTGICARRPPEIRCLSPHTYIT
ncbi:hypothetical protein HDU98_007538 [Podochytrium sp. JEL0797]|nr:hypothetical protein HDU98_007538 [Podochytrium sp. JEL0797]